MLTKNILPNIIIISVLLYCTFQQLVIPLEYGANQQAAQTKKQTNYHHHLVLNSSIVRPYNRSQTTRLFHNHKYINNYFSNQHENQPKRLHNLNRQSDTDHKKLQTYNLLPSTYAFSLPLKIAGINYKMSIDSGSSDIFIKGQNSAGKPKKRYQCGQTCMNVNAKYRIGYLDGHLQTYEAQLDVQIGEYTFMESILVAYEVEHNFVQNQGLIGLSFPQLASNPKPSFLQTLKNQGIIESYAFGVNLNFQNKKKSFITFGSYDNKFFEGELHMIPLTSHLFYYIDSNGVKIGDSQLMKVPTALFDTGNTCISIPHKYEQTILDQFNKGQGDTRNECFFQIQSHARMFSVLRCRVGNFDLMPIVSIQIGNVSYGIEKEYYLQACDRRPSQKQQQFHVTSVDGVWYCDTYIESVQRMKELFLGDGFFNRYYTYFDLQKRQIGIAKNKQVIKIQRIIRNELDADQQDWVDILTNLNPQQDRDDIEKQVEGMKKSEY